MFKFSNTKKVSEKTIDECSSLVEAFFRKVKLDPNKNRLDLENGYGWHLSRGSAQIYIFLNEFKNMSTLRVAAPVVYLPKENLLPFYRRCLEENFFMLNCGFALDKNVLFIVSERPVTGLDPEELDAMVTQVSFNADDFDNKLKDEFGAKMFNE